MLSFCRQHTTAPNLPSRAKWAAHAATRSRGVEISISFPPHSEQAFSFTFLNTFVSPPALKTERPPGIRSHVYQREALTGSLLLLEHLSHLSLKERSEMVQGKDKPFPSPKLRVDPHSTKTSAEDPVKQTLTSRLAPKGSCPQRAQNSQVPVQNGAVNV